MGDQQLELQAVDACPGVSIINISWSRCDIGKSQSEWTASNMRTAVAVHVRDPPGHLQPERHRRVGRRDGGVDLGLCRGNARRAALAAAAAATAGTLSATACSHRDWHQMSVVGCGTHAKEGEGTRRRQADR
eukprot:COSAG01_NODE_99_length_26583_cov_79.512536_4_plen_132_part_00